MRLLDFLAARLGQRVKSPGGLGGECVDLVELWAIGNGAHPLAGNAVDLYGNADPAQWARVPNGPMNAPRPGDVVVWHRSVPVHIGPYGHTAIALVADDEWLLTADQNWTPDGPVALVLHTYAGCTGWLQRR